jgi:tetratricopeptide (TPR) repeat protein
MGSQILKRSVWLLAATGLFAGAVVVSQFYGSDTDSLLAMELKPTFGPADFNAALAAVNNDLALSQERVARAPDQWLGYEGLAMGHLIKAQMTGSFDDLKASNAVIAKGMQFAPEVGGPVLAASTINLSLHRYPGALRYLGSYDRFVVTQGPVEEAEVLGQKGEIAFYSGDYRSARDLYAKAQALDPSVNTIFRQATWQKYLGEFDQAIALYQQGALKGRVRTPEMLATYHLQIGALELQRGNWDLARDYFERADKLFPGHWLAQAHVAQMQAVSGERAQAKAAYRGIIGRTNNPDVMMALANVLEFEGDTRGANALRGQAARQFEQRVRVFPEAYADHAADLAITIGDDDRALELAKVNYRARPFGDAAIALARAQLATGNPRDAITLLQKVNSSGWKSVEQHIVLSEAYAAIGDDAQSARYQKMAIARNPKALDPESEMLAFGNH